MNDPGKETPPGPTPNWSRKAKTRTRRRSGSRVTAPEGRGDDSRSSGSWVRPGDTRAVLPGGRALSAVRPSLHSPPSRASRGEKSPAQDRPRSLRKVWGHVLTDPARHKGPPSPPFPRKHLSTTDPSPQPLGPEAPRSRDHSGSGSSPPRPSAAASAPQVPTPHRAGPPGRRSPVLPALTRSATLHPTGTPGPVARACGVHSSAGTERRREVRGGAGDARPLTRAC